MDITTADLVRARFLEAADTDRRLPRARIHPAGDSSFWPAFVHSFEDRVGWGAKRHAEEEEARNDRRLPPSAEAIRRFEECLDWTIRHVAEDRRALLWAWAFAQSGRGSFADWCRSRGMVRMTAYRRLEAIVDRIAANLGKGGVFLDPPAEHWVLQIVGETGISSHMIGAGADDAPPQSPVAIMSDDAKPSGTAGASDFSWAQKQWEREQRRRKALGAA